ncbi:MAG: host attachment protein [Campylobacterales bacterium]|nr:host attachment protein [Campylobacterales bacterium]
MNGDIIIVANSGSLEVCKIEDVKGIDPQETRNVAAGTQKERSNLRSITKIDYIEPHTRTSDDMSDQLGRRGHSSGEQPQGEGRGIQLSTSSGEPHNLALEEERRGMQLIANDIIRVVSDAKPQRWHLAFPQENLDRLLEMIDTKTKETLGKSIGKNLVNAHVKDLLSFFE